MSGVLWSINRGSDFSKSQGSGCQIAVCLEQLVVAVVVEVVTPWAPGPQLVVTMTALGGSSLLVLISSSIGEFDVKVPSLEITNFEVFLEIF